MEPAVRAAIQQQHKPDIGGNDGDGKSISPSGLQG